MCYYNLHVCPHPHQDPISSAIYDPSKADNWVKCSLPKPWGRLSCGLLFIEHPTNSHENARDATIEHSLAMRFIHPEERAKYAHPKCTADPRCDLGETSITPLPSDAHRQLGTECEWCTLTLRIVATKAHYLQKELKPRLVELERKMEQDQSLRAMQEQIAEKEKELEMLRYDAWRVALSAINKPEKAGKENQGTPDVEVSQIE